MRRRIAEVQAASSSSVPFGRNGHAPHSPAGLEYVVSSQAQKNSRHHGGELSDEAPVDMLVVWCFTRHHCAPGAPLEYRTGRVLR